MDTQRQVIDFNSSAIPGGCVNLVGEIVNDLTPPTTLVGTPTAVGQLSFDIPLTMLGIGWTLNKAKCDGAKEINGARYVSSIVPGDGVTLLQDAPMKLEPSVIPFPQRAAPRAPLPPPPSGDYATNYWFNPPAQADKRFWRMNFGCVTIPGLPFVPGMEDLNFDRVLTGFFGRYSADWQKVILDTYAERPYSHFLRWVQDEQSYPGYSIQKYVDECKAIKAAGIPYIVHSFLSKDYAPSNPSVQYCRDTFGPLIDALQAEGLLDIAIVGFELTSVAPNSSLFDLIDYFAVERGLTEANGCPLYVHHISGYTWPGVGAPDRFRWWQAQVGKLTGLCYQCDPAWPYRLMQDRIRDTTDNTTEGFPNTDSGFGHPFDLVAAEPQLERSFGNGADLNEDNLDQCGYYLQCTPGALPVMGFGCGARKPDGSFI